MKKLITMFIAIALLLHPMMASANTVFKDVSTSHWAYTAINALQQKKIVGGVGGGLFKPEDKVNRDQFIKMVIVALGYDLEQGKSYWAQPHIDKAIELGLFKKGDFLAYNVPMTREQMAHVVVNAALLKETAPSSNLDDYIIKNTKDFYTISDYYKQSVLYSYQLGLIAGFTDNTFKPKSVLTRAEASVVVMRLLDKAWRKPLKTNVDNNYILQMTDVDGNLATVYPPSKLEVIETAKVLMAAQSKSKGYGETLYNPYMHKIANTYYENKEARDKRFNDPFTMEILEQLFIDINTSDATLKYSNPYMINVNLADKVNELHKEVVYTLFNHLFETDANKMISKFNAYMQYGEDISKSEKVRFNNREVSFLKAPYQGFQIVISLKQ